ncbi:MAG TPA: hypothetical protein VMO88_04185 [Acidimicrobiales bacterium]|nr:hypothetical protein [Acidimicrobiales bacterium]
MASSADWSADWLLTTWARIVETLSVEYADFGLGVTINVGGSTYSGVLVSGRKWVAEMASVLQSKAMDPRIAYVLAQSFDEVLQQYDNPEFLNQATQFLHLLHASVVDPQGQRTGEGLPMRIKLDAVAAWAVAGWAVGTSNWATPEATPAL